MYKLLLDLICMYIICMFVCSCVCCTSRWVVACECVSVCANCIITGKKCRQSAFVHSMAGNSKVVYPQNSPELCWMLMAREQQKCVSVIFPPCNKHKSNNNIQSTVQDACKTIWLLRRMCDCPSLHQSAVERWAKTQIRRIPFTLYTYTLIRFWPTLFSNSSSFFFAFWPRIAFWLWLVSLFFRVLPCLCPRYFASSRVGDSLAKRATYLSIWFVRSILHCLCHKYWIECTI